MIIDKVMFEKAKKTAIEKVISDFGWKCMLKASAMKDKADVKIETYRKATECWKCGPPGMTNKHMKNVDKNYFVKQLDGVGINRNKQINSINSHVTNYTIGVHSTGDWSDWYNVPYNLTIFCVCIPRCSKYPITRRKVNSTVITPRTQYNHSRVFHHPNATQ